MYCCFGFDCALSHVLWFFKFCPDIDVRCLPDPVLVLWTIPVEYGLDLFTSLVIKPSNCTCFCLWRHLLPLESLLFSSHSTTQSVLILWSHNNLSTLHIKKIFFKEWQLISAINNCSLSSLAFYPYFEGKNNQLVRLHWDDARIAAQKMLIKYIFTERYISLNIHVFNPFYGKSVMPYLG